MFSQRRWLFMVLTAFYGCASGPTTKPSGADRQSVIITVSLLRADSASHQFRAFQAGDILAAGEPLTVEVTASQASHIAVVMHSPSGESEALSSDLSDGAPLSPGAQRRFVVPRRSPPGVSETELRLLVVASRESLSAAARGLLRLPCGDSDGGRGDRGKDEKKAKEVQKPSADKSQPKEGIKKGPYEDKLCASSAGIFAPLTVIPIVVSSQ